MSNLDYILSPLCVRDGAKKVFNETLSGTVYVACVETTVTENDYVNIVDSQPVDDLVLAYYKLYIKVVFESAGDAPDLNYINYSII